MATIHSGSTDTVVHDPKTGRMVTVRGVGALKGQLKLRKSVDLTKPIASQASKGTRKRKAPSTKQA